jgi:hypothetical protein
LGAAITVWGSVWIINLQASKKAARDKANLLSFLAMLESRLQFTKSEEALAKFVMDRDVPRLINLCALVLEMADLLSTSAVADAAEGYRQLYTLHRLRRVLKIWSHVFARYADIPYTDFYILASPKDFEEAVEKLIVPTTIIRASVHMYIAEITGRNAFMEEVKKSTEGMSQTWNPDHPYLPVESKDF